jgi:dihydropteroate synthase
MQSLKIRNTQFDWGSRTYIMGILNVTPDSFSDGGDFSAFQAAIAQSRRMIAAGADILDIGGQSTRPGAETISVEEELKRTIAIIKALRQEFEVPISIDTTRSRIAEAAIEAGADWVNDISGATFDPHMLTTVARLQVPLILMHIKGTPQTMQQLTDYQDLIGEITQFFVERITAAEQAGISRSQITIDPGIGFAKTAAQNIQLLQQLSQFQSLNLPILVGVSRKSFIGKILDQSDPKARIWGTAAACVAAIAGGADILRVHDVKEMGEVSRVADAIWR